MLGHVARTHDAGAGGTAGESESVGQRHHKENAFQEVVAVGASPHHMQKKVEFGGRRDGDAYGVVFGQRYRWNQGIDGQKIGHNGIKRRKRFLFRRSS